MIKSLRKNEGISYQKLSPEEMKAKGILGRLIGPCADFRRATRNGRKYSEKLWENVFADPIMQEKIKNGVCFGELGHPADRTETDMEKIAICLREQPKKNSDGLLLAVFDILDTPNGRILKTLCDYGSTLAVSSRGTGDIITDADGNEAVDPDTYECECFDIVLVPGVESARLQYVTEGLDSNNLKMKKALCESLEHASEEDKKIMEETLNNLNIKLDEEKQEEEKSVCPECGKEPCECKKAKAEEQPLNEDEDEEAKEEKEEEEEIEIPAEAEGEPEAQSEAGIEEPEAEEEVEIEDVPAEEEPKEEDQPSQEDIFWAYAEANLPHEQFCEICKTLGRDCPECEVEAEEEVEAPEAEAEESETKPEEDEEVEIEEREVEEALKESYHGDPSNLVIYFYDFLNYLREKNINYQLKTEGDSKLVYFGNQTKSKIQLGKNEDGSYFVQVGKTLIESPDEQVSFEELLKEIGKPEEEGWTELLTSQAVKEFGKGAKWVVAYEPNDTHFKWYTKDGEVFVGKGEGDSRVLALKKPDGTIHHKTNIYDMPIKEAFKDRAPRRGLTPDQYGKDVTEKIKKLLDLGFDVKHPAKKTGTAIEVLNILKPGDPDSYIIGTIKPEAAQYFADRYEERLINAELKAIQAKEKAKETKNAESESFADKSEEPKAKEEPKEAVNDGDSALLQGLQEALKNKTDLEAQVRELQEQLAVSETKASKALEESERYKSAAARLSELAKERKAKISTLDESLKTSQGTLEDKQIQLTRLVKGAEQHLEEVKALNESLSAKETAYAQLNESFEKAKADYEAQIATLKEAVAEEQQKATQVKSLTEDLNKQTHIAEGYQKLANKAMSRYIECKATMLGVNPKEIKSRLPESFSLDSVDRVCEDLKTYQLNVSKLPFSLGSKVKSVKVNESVTNPKLPNEGFEDDDVDESLLKLSGLQF